MPSAQAPDELPRLLVVEDDPGLQKQLKWSLEGYDLAFASTREEAVAAVRRLEPPVVLQDLGLPPDAAGISEGLAALGEILTLAPAAKVIVMTGNADRAGALEAVRRGAYDFYQKPVDLEVLKLILGRAFNMAALEAENRSLASALGRSPIEGIIAVDEAMLRLCRTVEKIAPTDVSVLVLGESGTGKEVIARALHRLSERRDRRFVAINCAAIPENLLESELFGHEKGSFTGAHKQTIGKVELADGGTLFLDEIGDMPPSLQAKLLRFLQERVIERIGGRQEIPVNVRVICATNQDLQALIAEGRFREDLFYRIGEVPLRLPPLRDRRGDLMVLARAFLQRFSRELGMPVRGFAPDALSAIESYPWPGNVRELENKVKGAVILAEGPLVTAEGLNLPVPGADALPFSLREARANAERSAIVAALAAANGNMSKAAELLGVSRPTLYDLVQKLGIPPAE
jgi:two-component system NtrC family response regulator